MTEFSAGTPFEPMTATSSLDQTYDKSKLIQKKYKGERAIIHIIDDSTVEVYSSDEEEISSDYEWVNDIEWNTEKTVLDGILYDEHVVLFDYIVREGIDLSSKPLGVRHIGLSGLLGSVNGPVELSTLFDSITEAENKLDCDEVIVKNGLSEYEKNNSNEWKVVEMN